MLRLGLKNQFCVYLNNRESRQLEHVLIVGREKSDRNYRVQLIANKRSCSRALAAQLEQLKQSAFQRRRFELNEAHICARQWRKLQQQVEQWDRRHTLERELFIVNIDRHGRRQNDLIQSSLQLVKPGQLWLNYHDHLVFSDFKWIW